LLWPTAATLVALAILVGLGTWQLQRLRWKEGIIARIAARTGAPAEPLERIRAAEAAGGDVEYSHARVRGRFRHGEERYLYAPAPAGLGWQVLTPLEWAPSHVVWVNRGFVPDARKAPATRPLGQVTGEVEVRGLVRQPRATTFTPLNDTAGNLWYWADVAGLTRSAFAAVPVTADPFILEADADPAPPGGLPQGGVTRLVIANRHLEYALTWFGLALTLIGVYCAFAIGRLRPPKGSP
jgi:surfeit locus 1 family protein